MTSRRLNALTDSGQNAMARGNFAVALQRFSEALQIKRSDAYANYGKAYCLAELEETTKDPLERARMRRNILKTDRYLLSLLPEKKLKPRFSDEGDLQRSIRAQALNHLAWFGIEQAKTRSDFERLLRYVDGSIRQYEDLDEPCPACYHTKVKILLKLGLPDEAYRWTRIALQKDPRSTGYKEIVTSPAYRRWLVPPGVRSWDSRPSGRQVLQAIRKFFRFLAANRAREAFAPLMIATWGELESDFGYVPGSDRRRDAALSVLRDVLAGYEYLKPRTREWLTHLTPLERMRADQVAFRYERGGALVNLCVDGEPTDVTVLFDLVEAGDRYCLAYRMPKVM